jgi:hypothetical protein
MSVSVSGRKKSFLILCAALMISAIISGCSGMTPVDLRNNREEGPEKGLFTSSQGEFVIFRGEEAAKTDHVGEKSKKTPEQ